MAAPRLRLRLLHLAAAWLVGPARPAAAGQLGDDFAGFLSGSSSMASAARAPSPSGLRSLVQNSSSADAGAVSSSNASTGFLADFEPASCTLGMNCSQGGIPIERGLCVIAKDPGAGRACWDVCNPLHAPMDYKTRGPAEQNVAISMSYAGMIESVRAGLNPMVRCPGNLVLGDPCPPGDFCSDDMRQHFHIPRGRGLCVIDSSAQGSRSCWDACDYRRSPVDFTMGTPEGTAAMVAGLRRGDACPGIRWWQVLLVSLAVLLVLACCMGFCWLMKNRGSRKRSRQAPLEPSRYEPEPMDYRSAQGESMMMEAQEMGGKSQDMRDFRPSPIPEDGAADMTPPPEPPRVDPYGSDPYGAEPYGPPPQQEPAAPSNMYAAEPAWPPPAPAPPQQPVATWDRSFFPGGAAPATQHLAPIPGLDEPNLLLANLPALMPPQVPGMDPFLGTPASPQQYFLGTTQSVSPQVLPNSFMMGAQQVQPSFHTLVPSFHTQLPSVYTITPPTSVQLPPGHQWYTPLQRR